jgi:2-keto-4-pentenoate hydratase
MNEKINSAAKRLDEAMRTRVPIAPLTDSDELSDAATAYAIQSAWTKVRTARGEKIVGRKIGLTSEAIQTQFGIDQPDYGNLWNTTQYVAQNGIVEISTNDFLQPRLEGEVAFLLRKSLREPGITAEQVLAATDAFALGVEIVDSRIADWKIKLADTIADNASYGGFTLGPWDKQIFRHDFGALSMAVTQNGRPAANCVGGAGTSCQVRCMACEQVTRFQYFTRTGRYSDFRWHYQNAAS